MRIKRNLLWWIKLFSTVILICVVLTWWQDNKSDEEIDKFIASHPDLKKKYFHHSLMNEENQQKNEKDKDPTVKEISNSKKVKLKTPGENGEPYFLPKAFDDEKDKLYRTNGFNARASDDIPLNRTLPDIRHPKCKSMEYPSKLPLTSVIIPFYNEHWSTLLRTFISVLNRSPPESLLEVILVDDGSKKVFLKEKLDNYLTKYPKVKMIHLKKRAGLIRARLAGAKAAKGEVIIFLDSHTECTDGWLPPLLNPIINDYKTCVCPFIDVIDYETFAYRAQDEGARGAFDWQLYYKRLPLLDSDKRNMPNPFKSPVMAGGLFAISSKFFWELGGYDSGLEIWGGEQYELSFKIWQCGGIMVDAPCSRIGHIYRKFAPFSNPGGGDFLGRNYKRVAEVWMDEYAEYVYKRRPHYRHLNPGDLSEQKALRQKLNCKSFKWFMTEIAFDLTKVYPPIEPPDFANGTIQSIALPHLCIDTQYKNHLERFGLQPCQSGGEQVFHLSWHKDIRPGKRSLCWDVSSGDVQAPVLLYNCHGGGGNQLWRYDHKKQQIIHGSNPRCLDSNPGNKEIFLATCDNEKITQKWIFQRYDAKLLENWNSNGLIVA